MKVGSVQYRYLPYSQNREYPQLKKSSQKNSHPNIETSIYKTKGLSDVSFGNKLINDYIYDKTIMKHVRDAMAINPAVVEDYFESLGVPCTFRAGTEEMRKIAAFCCFHSAEIFRKLNLVLPKKIDLEPASTDNIIGVCYYRSDSWKKYPIRTVTFNTRFDWTDYIQRFKTSQGNGYFSTNHFLHPFIHEFGHSVHYNNFYSRWGCQEGRQGYVYNPDVESRLERLNIQMYDKNGAPKNMREITPQVRNIMNRDSSRYGAVQLPELFAEEFTRAVLNEINPATLRLEGNPFPIKNLTPEMRALLKETWEGWVGDAQGLI